MGTQSRRTNPSVEQLLFEEGNRFDFFQAVRLIERLYPNRHAVGRFAAPDEEVVRFRSRLSAGFPPSDIDEIVTTEEGQDQVQMTVAFMGLAGPLGVLPRHYLTLLLQRIRNGDYALRDFLDLFNHRLISLFYRAWEKYRFPIVYERAALHPTGRDPLSRYVLALSGMGDNRVRQPPLIEEETLIFYAGLLSRQPRSARALEQILSDYFGVAINIIQFVGQWLPLDEADRSSLAPNRTNNALGEDAVLGGRVWDQHAKFRLRVGPLSLHTFASFLPSGKALNALLQLVQLIVGQDHDFDVQLILKGSDVPPCRLGARGEHAPRLGWSAWFPAEEKRRDVDNTVFAGHLDLAEPAVVYSLN
jgi:type VI secretion system protein ImpH